MKNIENNKRTKTKKDYRVIVFFCLNLSHKKRASNK